MHCMTYPVPNKFHFYPICHPIPYENVTKRELGDDCTWIVAVFMKIRRQFVSIKGDFVTLQHLISIFAGKFLSWCKIVLNCKEHYF